MKKYDNIGLDYPSGFDPNTSAPIDVRLVVSTLSDRNNLEYIYPSMPVTVLGPASLIGGIPTYPAMSNWRCLVERTPNYTGATTTDADWKRDDAPSSLTSGGYKGAWNASTNAPNLNDQALLATLKAGDYYKVSVAGATSLNGIKTWAQNDSAFWDGSQWAKFENTNPNAVTPLYNDTQGATFQTDVLALIRLGILTEWTPGPYLRGAYVKSTYNVPQLGSCVDTYLAVNDMAATEAALPTPTSPNPRWQLITTTNVAKLAGGAQNGDSLGKAATGAAKPKNPSTDKYLSPQETDARIRQYGGGATGAIFDVDRDTFQIGIILPPGAALDLTRFRRRVVVLPAGTPAQADIVTDSFSSSDTF